MELDYDPEIEAHYRERLDQDPGNTPLRHKFASLLFSWGFDERAAEILDPDWRENSKYRVGLREYEGRLRQNPSDATTIMKRGIWHNWHEAFKEALDDYALAISLNSGLSYAYCARASLRATCPDASFRRGESALEDARMAMTLAEHCGELNGDWKHRVYLQVLAAACAETNNFAEAIKFQTAALDLALTKTVRSQISQRLELYRTWKPLRIVKGLIC